MVDTVKNAELTPEEEQPWAELGLNAEEYAHIRDILGRRPTGSELAMYSVMWAEHCSYKSSKVHLKRFGVLDPVTPRGPLLAGIGDNAGVVDIGQGYAVTFKAESHNSPSYVEPHQGAATGIGGIVRDILAMGARPVAVMDALRFGPLDGPDTPRVMHGAVAGISNYGNSLGLPNIGGELMFDQSYAGNPLVNALAVGVLRHEDLKRAQATGVGNRVIMYGARTGGDGIGGASILSSQSFDSAAESKRPAVQVGDPFMEKLLIEATLELFEAGVISALQDFGAAGISCATSELASAGEGGMWVDLNQVKLRDHTLTPEEILMSESQERMMAIVEPDKVEQFMEICAKWEVEAADIGEVTDDDRLIIEYDGEVIVDVPPRTVAHEGPVYERPYERRVSQDAIEADSSDMLARPHTGEQLAETFRAVLTAPNQADKSWVTDQYDRFVRGNTVLAQPADSGVIRVDEDTNLGFALSVDANSRFTWLNPYLGAQLSLLEAYRNVATTGATPVAITDCLNYGSPEDPEVMWTFVETIKGLVDGCRELGTPVTGGNVSFYNQTDEVAVLPTPLIGMLGVIDDVRHHNPMGFRETDHEIWQLGVTHEELDGSAWADAAHGHLGGRPPRVDFAAEKNLAAVLIAAAQEQLVSSAHDLADGGLAVALAESCLRHGVGARVRLEGDPFVGLFSESGARAIVSVTGDNAARLAELAAAHGVAAGRLGETTDQAQIEVEGQFALPLDTVGQAWSAVLPEALDGAVEADVVE